MHSRVPIRTYTHDVCAVWIVRINLNINDTIVEVDARRAIRRFDAIKHQAAGAPLRRRAAGRKSSPISLPTTLSPTTPSPLLVEVDMIKKRIGPAYLAGLS